MGQTEIWPRNALEHAFQISNKPEHMTSPQKIEYLKLILKTNECNIMKNKWR